MSGCPGCSGLGSKLPPVPWWDVPLASRCELNKMGMLDALAPGSSVAVGGWQPRGGQAVVVREDRGGCLEGAEDPSVRRTSDGQSRRRNGHGPEESTSEHGHH